jgi:AraC family transcriptional regulator
MSLSKIEFFQSEILNVSFVECRNADPRKGDVEESQGYALIFPVKGMFVQHLSRNNRVVADRNSALLRAGRTAFRVSHPLTTEDDCLVFEFSENSFYEISEFLTSTFGNCAHLSPRIVATRNLILRGIRLSMLDPLEIEEFGVSLLRSFFHHSRFLTADRSERSARDVDAAKIVLQMYPEKRWTLTGLGRALGCSPFYLTRIFHEEVGVPLHQYLIHSRLNQAIDLLLESTLDLSEIAMETGFSSHSHFTSSFRKQIGVTPGRMREIATSNLVRQVRDFLAARF